MTRPLSKVVKLTNAEMRRRIDAALGGDRDATDQLVEDLAPVIHVRVARALMRRKGQARGRDLRHDLEDMVQNVFASLFANDGRALQNWDPDRGLSLERFVGFLAEREVGMLMRTGKRNPWTEDPTMNEQLNFLSGSDEGAVARIESRDLLERVVEHLRDRLSPRGRQYFQLIYVENESIRDVAEATGTNPQAIYAWRSRVVKLVRDLVRDMDAEEQRDVG